MIIYDRSKKELFIPKGIGNFSNGNYEDGYERGRAAQAAEDEAKLSTTAITSNGEYNADYGFSSVVVDVDCSGGTCNLQSLNRTPMASELVDGKYLEYAASATTGLDGWDNIKLDMGYIIAKGERNQKAKLASKTITENGEYTRADGWSAVTVNVPPPEIRLQDKTIRTSGVYTADSGYTGLGTVTVTPHIQASVSGTFVQLADERVDQLFVPLYSGEGWGWAYITIDGVQLIDGTEIITEGTHTFEFLFGNTELPPFKFYGQVDGPIVCNFYPRHRN